MQAKFSEKAEPIHGKSRVDSSNAGTDEKPGRTSSTGSNSSWLLFALFCNVGKSATVVVNF